MIPWLSEKSNLPLKEVKVFQLNQKLKTDLIAPSDVKKVNKLIEMLDKPENKNMVASINNNINGMNDTDRRRLINLRDKFESNGYPKNVANLYAAFSMSLYASPEIRTKYFEELKKDGYNMIIDTEDAGKYAQAPIIVFDNKDSLKVLSVKELPKEWSQEWNDMQLNYGARDKRLDKSLKGFN